MKPFYINAKIMMGALKILVGLHGLAQNLLIRKAWQSLNFQGFWSALSSLMMLTSANIISTELDSANERIAFLIRIELALPHLR